MLRSRFVKGFGVGHSTSVVSTISDDSVLFIRDVRTFAQHGRCNEDVCVRWYEAVQIVRRSRKIWRKEKISEPMFTCNCTFLFIRSLAVSGRSVRMEQPVPGPWGTGSVQSLRDSWSRYSMFVPVKLVCITFSSFVTNASFFFILYFALNFQI